MSDYGNAHARIEQSRLSRARWKKCDCGCGADIRLGGKYHPSCFIEKGIDKRRVNCGCGRIEGRHKIGAEGCRWHERTSL